MDKVINKFAVRFVVNGTDANVDLRSDYDGSLLTAHHSQIPSYEKTFKIELTNANINENEIIVKLNEGFNNYYKGALVSRVKLTDSIITSILERFDINLIRPTQEIISLIQSHLMDSRLLQKIQK